MSILDALKTREGSLYLGGAVVTSLVVAMTLASTVTTYMEQEEIRDAVLLFSQGRSTSRSALGALRQSEAGDESTRAAIRVMLASYNYDRAYKNPQLLDTAEKLYEEALQIDPGQASAAVGLACVAFTRAEVKDRDARARDADAALSEFDRRLREGGGTDMPDVAYLKGAGLILQGKADKALALLDDPNPKTAPSQEGTGARYWNLGVAELITGSPQAAATFAMGYAMRPFAIPREYSNQTAPKDEKSPGRLADPPRILALAWRVVLSKKPKEAATQLERCEQAKMMMTPFGSGPGPLGKGQAGRFLPHREDSALVRNALGLGYFHAGNFSEAATQFDMASKRANGKEPLFLQNLGWAQYQAARRLKGSDSGMKNRRRSLYDRASKQFATICRLLNKQKGRETAVRNARTNAAAIRLEGGDKKGALDIYRRFVAGDPDPVVWSRDLGALFDHRGKVTSALKNYRKAIGLQHPDTSELVQRIAELEAR